MVVVYEAMRKNISAWRAKNILPFHQKACLGFTYQSPLSLNDLVIWPRWGLSVLDGRSRDRVFTRLLTSSSYEHIGRSPPQWTCTCTPVPQSRSTQRTGTCLEHTKPNRWVILQVRRRATLKTHVSVVSHLFWHTLQISMSTHLGMLLVVVLF